MATPEEIEAAAGIQPADEMERKRIWAAAQALAAPEGRAPSAADLASAERVLRAAADAATEHLEAGRGRAVITISDGRDEDEVEVGVQFTPELEERGGDEVAGTQAQLLALEILENAFGEAAGGDADHGHSHD